MQARRHVFRLMGVLVFGIVMMEVGAEAAYPDKAVDFIAPASPGGGWDLTCRLAAKVLKESGLITQPIVVSNKTGGFGMVAMTDIVRNRRKDNNVLLAFSAVLTTQMASNNNPYRWKDITPIASLFVDYGAFAVRKDSKYATLKDLLEDWKQNPGVLTFAGSSGPGGMDHMRVAMLAKAIGVPVKGVRYVAFPSGGEALSALLGGHTTAFVGEAGEIASQVESGAVRALVALADQKLPGPFAKVPMAKELGLEVVSPNWRGFYGPPEMTKDVVRFWEETFGKMVKTAGWKQVLDQQSWVEYFQTGEKLKKFLDDELAMYERLAKELELVK
jgi:putative tricarboxylic transport membrane protein